MKQVEAPYPFMEPPAVPAEDMTQPMGPLEEGDQALVDAAHRIPAGVHEVRSDDGVLTRVVKDEGVGRDVVVTHTYNPDHTGKEATAMITSTPGIEGINAGSGEWPVGENGGLASTEVHKNEIQDGPSILDMTPDRKKAQAEKLRIAREIDEAGQRADTRVKNPELAREMALAEKPHRDEIAERNQKAAAAGEAAEEAAKRYFEDRNLAGELHKRSQQAAKLGSAARRANEISLAHADDAAEATRQEHEVR